MVDTPKDLAHEAQRGRTPRTPAILLGGVTLTVTILVVVILAAALIVYYVTK